MLDQDKHSKDPKNIMFSQTDYIPPVGWTVNDVKEVNDCQCELYQKGWPRTNTGGFVASKDCLTVPNLSLPG